jgi:four helix bundle protein
MSRDHRKLRVFALADQLVLAVYRASSAFPACERYGLQAQLRKAAVSSVANIVEGSARRTDREYSHFLNIAAGSAAEARYLCDLSGRLDFVACSDREGLEEGDKQLCAGLTALIRSLDSGSETRTQGSGLKAQGSRLGSEPFDSILKPLPEP